MKEAPTASRRRSREVALQVLFALDVQRTRSDDADAPEVTFDVTEKPSITIGVVKKRG